jgi:Sec-independent protein translocase protein TatA
MCVSAWPCSWPALLGLLDIGPIELMIVLAAAVMLFGGDLPDIARRAGQFVGRLRSSAQEFTRDLDAPRDLTRLPPPPPPRAPPADPPAAPPEPAPPTEAGPTAPVDADRPEDAEPGRTS